MTERILSKKTDVDHQWYSEDIPIRGCQLSLPQIRSAYQELSTLTKQKGEPVVDGLVRPKGANKAQFEQHKEMLRDKAFRLTVSIVGFNGQTAYGESDEIFSSENLPYPIKTIFFTNQTAYGRYANGELPVDRFALSIHFEKPPLFDPNPILSDPTPNLSSVELNADDVGYFRAVQTIIKEKLIRNKRWYSFIHEKFAYDVGLWFLALPFALYWVTIYADYFLPKGSELDSFRIAFFIYGLGMSLLLYRALFGYVKWAYPVNVLEENKDMATRHRITLAAIVMGLLVSSVRSVLNTFLNFG